MPDDQTEPHATTGRLQLLAGAFFISFSPIFVELASIGPGMAGFYRTFWGGLFLAVIVAARRETIWRGWKPLFLILGCGALFALDLSFWHRSIQYVGPGLATLLGNFQVFFLATFGILFFGERVGVRFVASVALALLGISLLVGFDPGGMEPDLARGLTFGLLTSIVYAVFVLLLRRSQSRDDSLPPFANMCLLSLATALTLGIEEQAVGADFHIPDRVSWLAMLGYGFVGQVLGWVLISRGLPKVKRSLAGLLLLLQPVLSYVWEILFFGKELTLRELAGASIALAAIYLGSVRRGPRKTPPEHGREEA